jgi:hypothetical protein
MAKIKKANPNRVKTWGEGGGEEVGGWWWEGGGRDERDGTKEKGNKKRYRGRRGVNNGGGKG